MEKPYRYLRRLMKDGNSVVVAIPTIWFDLIKDKKVKDVVVEVDQEKVMILPSSNKKK